MDIKSILRRNSLARYGREFATKINSFKDSPHSLLVRSLKNSKILKVIDVGANVGQFGVDLRRHGFEGQIFSYEPVTDAFKSLVSTASQNPPWKPFQLGLGSVESQRTINVSGNAGLSSSFLKMKSTHVENFPKSSVVSQEQILVSTLDKQLNILDIEPNEVLLKIDVQGFEAEVLKGASQSLSKIPFCFIELSLEPLYEGEKSLLSILNELSKHNHEVFDVFRGIKAKDGRLLQVDILTKLVTE